MMPWMEPRKLTPAKWRDTSMKKMRTSKTAWQRLGIVLLTARCSPRARSSALLAAGWESEPVRIFSLGEARAARPIGSDPIYESSSEDELSIGSLPSTDHIEFMSRFLDREMSNSLSEKNPYGLPEFVGSRRGIFKLPERAAMHPSRPPSLELRPHPLRESQVGSFLRTIVCTD